MNHIPEIAKMLGVEIGEEFLVNGKSFLLTETGIMKYFNDGHGSEKWTKAEVTTYDLLNGEKKITKLPFEPKVGDKYYYIDFFSVNCKPTPCSEKWEGNNCDYQAKFCGNCFRTWEEANTHAHEIYKKLTGRVWKE